MNIEDLSLERLFELMNETLTIEAQDPSIEPGTAQAGGFTNEELEEEYYRRDAVHRNQLGD